MRLVKTTLAALTLSVSALALPAFADNPMLEKDFWKEADLAKVEAAIAEGNSATDITDNGFTPLIRALYAGASVDVIDYLVEQGADVNRLGHDERPGFLWAARGGNLEMVKHVIDLGADPMVEDYSGRNALGFAAFGQTDLEVLKFLAEDLELDPEQLDRMGRNAGLSAAYYNTSLEAVQYLAGLCDMTIRTNEGMDAFMLAAYRNKNVEVVRALMEISEDPFAREEDYGGNALHLAAIRGDLDKIDFLISEGFDPFDVTDNEGRDVMSLAAYRNSAEVVRALIDRGLDVNRGDAKGRTPLFYAAQRNKPEVVALLIEAGADVNAQNDHGATPLIVAAGRDRKGAEEIMSMLIEAGADMTATDAHGLNGLLAAVDAGHGIETVKMFLDAGVDVNGVNRDLMSPLMLAALKGKDPAIVTMLLDAGADVTLADDFGDTAADMIAENMHMAGSDAAARLAE